LAVSIKHDVSFRSKHVDVYSALAFRLRRMSPLTSLLLSFACVSFIKPTHFMLSSINMIQHFLNVMKF
jgi:hypothetical protein